MPRVLKAGDNINGYTITQHLNTGAMANAFAAKSPTGTKVFFKQYKSPAVAVPWFNAYVQYQQDLNARVQQPNLKRFCVHQLDSFVFKFGVPTFFQAYEFIEGGHDLGGILEKLKKNPSSLTWNQRIILAKVMMAGIHQLHAHKIAHCDLKPPNLQMLEDKTIEAGYQLKLIDMDFSVLADKKAPWDGHAPYVGTPRYFSPEHLKGEIPTPQSDIFTCGIILYELLAEGHPFPADDDAAYFEKVKAYRVTPPKLLGRLPNEEATKQLISIIHRSLSPNPADRPTAKAINFALNGRIDSPVVPAATPVKISEPSVAAPKPSEPAPPVYRRLSLSNEAGASAQFNITTAIGKYLLRTFGDDAKFADPHQFTLERKGMEWWLSPQNNAMNFTLLNGEKALAPVKLNNGDKLALGSRTSDKTVLPLTVGLE